ncbi:hypothetical protein BpHYR1_048861 [Brachionus plicatilis]|uniref:Uncharacterized protein n=1 Tax=Brachionus plicatilis TaxID=10195 RepID=A0A3M7SM63_BRAPC|nr:hypothetical protein BpHYR1_048861 [Brachionus plicatilis]
MNTTERIAKAFINRDDQLWIQTLIFFQTLRDRCYLHEKFMEVKKFQVKQVSLTVKILDGLKNRSRSKVVVVVVGVVVVKTPLYIVNLSIQ